MNQVDKDVDEGIQAFSGPTVKAVLSQVRETLGADALIVDQRREGNRVIMRACVESPPEITVTEAAPAVAPQAPVEQPEPMDQLAPRLLARGFDQTTLKAFSQCTTEQAFMQSLLHSFSYRSTPLIELSGAYRLLGGAGVGKTTVIQQLLATWVASNPDRRVRVVTTDNQRLGGAESLMLACQLMQVPVQEVTDEQLAQHLHTHVTEDLLLIDTPAIHPQTALPLALPGVKDLWVVPVNQHVQQLTRLRQQLAALPLSGIVLGQAGELPIPADIYGLIHRWGLPLHWLSISANLRGGLISATADALGNLNVTDANPESGLAVAV